MDRDAAHFQHYKDLIDSKAVQPQDPKEHVKPTPPRRRIFSTVEPIEGVSLRTLREIDKNRIIRLQRQSSQPWVRSLGALRQLWHFFCTIVFDFTENHYFDNFVLFVVLLNTATLVAQTFESINVRAGWYFAALDCAFLAIYLMECALKIFVWGRLYFKNLWNDLDFFIVSMSVVDFLLPLLESAGSFSGGQVTTVFRVLKIFKGIRAIRAFRVLRTIRFLQNLHAIVKTCLQSFQSMGAIIILMFTFLLMFAVIFREMFSKSDPGRFGSMFRTVFTLFQLLTLDDWGFIYSTSRDHGAPHIIIFLILYIVVEYFTFLNLFIAVLVDNFQLTIKKRLITKYEQFQDSYEAEMQSIKKVEQQDSGLQTEEQFYEDTLKLTYSDNKYGEKERELITNYLRLLAAIDQNHQKFRSQSCILDRLINNCFEAADDSQGD